MTGAGQGHEHQHGREHHDQHGGGHHHHDGSGHDDARSGRTAARLKAVFRPHGHSSSDAVDPTLEASAEGMRALKLSLAGLLATAVLQTLVVVMTGSVALLADTIHNFADALTALPLAVAFSIGRRRPNRRYTYGYGRAEDLAGIFIVVVIALSAVFTGWEAVRRLMDPQDVHRVGWVAVAGLVGFFGNEAVAGYRIRVGRKIGSAALVADGYHARTDGITSLAVVAGALGVFLGMPLADPVVGLAIAVAILFVLRDAGREIYRRLMDSVDPALVDQVEGVLSAVPGIEAVSDVRIRWVGHELRAEAQVTSDCELSLAAAHAIAEEGHHRLLHELPRLAEVVIHTSPCDRDGIDHHASLAHHFAARAPRPPRP